MIAFKKLGMLTLATLLIGSSLSISSAEARDGQVATGVIGGLAAGTLLGATIANQNHGPEYVEDVYDAPPPRRRCWVEKQREPTYDEYGNFMGYQRVKREVCR